MSIRLNFFGAYLRSSSGHFYCGLIGTLLAFHFSCLVCWYFGTLVHWFSFATFTHPELTCYSSNCGNGLDKSVWHYHSTTLCSPTPLSLLFPPINPYNPSSFFYPFRFFFSLSIWFGERIICPWKLWFPFAVSKTIFFESLNNFESCSGAGK